MINANSAIFSQKLRLNEAELRKCMYPWKIKVFKILFYLFKEYNTGHNKNKDEKYKCIIDKKLQFNMKISYFSTQQQNR